MKQMQMYDKTELKKNGHGFPFGNERQFHNPSLMQTYEVHWSHPKSVDRWLKSLIIGSSLNVCKGKSNIGDITVDIMRELEPMLIADLFHLPFKDKSFDTVLCDPPFDYYATGILRRHNSWSWIQELRRIARKRLILATTLRCIRVGPGWQPQFFRKQTSSNDGYEVLADIHIPTAYSRAQYETTNAFNTISRLMEN